MVRAELLEECTTMRSRVLQWAMPALIATMCAVGCEDDGQMTVVGLNPRAGHIAGDQTVEVQGKHFRTDIGYTVYFGNAKAKAVTIRSSESIVVTTPQNPVGTVDVTLRADDGNAFLLKQAFKYEDMGGSVVEGIGETGERKEKGNLAY
jgi:IPT/TIG domain